MFVNQGDTAGDGNGGELGAIGECAFSNRCDTLGNGYRWQVRAIAESRRSDFLDALRNGVSRTIVFGKTSKNGLVANGLTQSIAVRECKIANLGNTVRKGKGSQSFTVMKCITADFGDHAVKLQFRSRFIGQGYQIARGIIEVALGCIYCSVARGVANNRICSIDSRPRHQAECDHAQGRGDR